MREHRVIARAVAAGDADLVDELLVRHMADAVAELVELVELSEHSAAQAERRGPAQAERRSAQAERGSAQAEADAEASSRLRFRRNLLPESDPAGYARSAPGSPRVTVISAGCPAYQPAPGRRHSNRRLADGGTQGITVPRTARYCDRAETTMPSPR